MAEMEETMADIKIFDCKPSNSNGATPPAVNQSNNDTDETDRNLPLRVKFTKFDMFYDMSGEKILIVFNHSVYEKTKYFGLKRPLERTNTEKDVESLNDTFNKLGFNVVVHQNVLHAEILRVMSEVCRRDHRATSCIAVAIMTHGDDGCLYAADRPYQMSDVTNILQNSDPGLVGKPKLLFVQACRGKSRDPGRRVQTDGPQESIVLPTHADTLIMLASAEKHVACRESNGSWLMQSLCEVFEDHRHTYDLLQLITLVNQYVAYKSTFAKYQDTNNMKMMPETKFTLTKLLRF